jgi:hypothetical protein
VTLTVTDNGAPTGTTATDSDSHPVTVTVITLTANDWKSSSGYHRIDLSWSGAATERVYVYRNGSRITSTSNDGSYRDSPGRRGAYTYVYKICERYGAARCSNEVTVTFTASVKSGPRGEGRIYGTRRD